MADGAPLDPAQALMGAARPRARDVHLAGRLLLLAESAAIYELPEAEAAQIERALTKGEQATSEALALLGLDMPLSMPEPMGDLGPDLGPVRALALTVSQGCNMACGYCYAAGGSFGGPSTRMDLDVARAAIDQLIESAPPGGAVKIAFMGGEPMMNRDLILQATSYARQRAAARAVSVGFSMTTNGTLLRVEDADFLAEQRFTVTVSLDGDAETNDKMRPMLGGAGSFERVARRLGPLLERSDQISLSARVTVTPDNLDISRTVAALGGLGFRSVGVSPMLASPTGQGALNPADFPVLLGAMMRAGEEWLQATLAGQTHPFANLATAVTELHRGKPRSQSCGAVRDYLAVDASGNYSACHRFVNDPLGQMGDLSEGIDHEARSRFMAERRVESQTPCQTCWARRLCGGGCHHEVLHVGRPACDFVRGWLHFSMGAYARLMAERPDWFDAA